MVNCRETDGGGRWGGMDDTGGQSVAGTGAPRHQAPEAAAAEQVREEGGSGGRQIATERHAPRRDAGCCWW